MARFPVLVFYAAVLCFTVRLVSSLEAAAAAGSCPAEAASFTNDLRSQCPVSISLNPPLQVDGNTLDRALSMNHRNGYTSILFYASWCPFSNNVLPKFEMLSSMFPQIEHLTIEWSSALPSVFSRYGIRSFPSIVVVNQTSKAWFHGPKDLNSVIEFYEKTTGFEPVQYLSEDAINMKECENCILQSAYRSSLEDVMKREPYMLFAASFICLRAVLLLFPKLLYRFKAFYGSYVPHLNLEIFGERSQLFGRIIHMIDVRRIWTKLKLCKTRNLHERAKSCRVWASSFASVSLGESSSSRS